MSLGDLMRETVVTTAPETPVSDVAATMRDENVGSVVVVAEDAPVGVVTDRDIAVRVAADGNDPETLTVADVMSADPVTVDADTGVFDLCTAMCDHEVRRMPVVDDGTLVGIVTLDDLLVFLTAELGSLAGVIGAESPPY
jgi:CBS domain-containing protein